MERTFLVVVTSVLLASASFAHETPNQHHEPFQTMQPDGSIITLVYQGDDDFHWYEDLAGYTVVKTRGEYRYAILKDGILAPSAHVVGAVKPASVGLTPGILPSAKSIERMRSRARTARAKRVEPLNDRIPADSTLIEGCIMVRNSGHQGDPARRDANIQSGVSETTGHWTNGLVYYTFDANVTSTNRAAMRAAMDSWEAVANVRFIQRTNQPNYIYIFDGTGNWSYIGMIGGRQDLSIYNWNYEFIMMHELAHALGVWHEQSRSDRATYVQINYGNIQTGMEHNFDIEAGAQLVGGYDFDSIMHYGPCAFANCTCSSSCRTITCLAPYQSYQNVIGQRTHLSVGDAEHMAHLYGSPNQVSGMAEMITPANNGDLITGGSITFEWTVGSLVQEYRLVVGSGVGLGDYYDVAGNATNANVTNLPIEGGDVHVRLYSKIGGTWYNRSYTYPTDLCPGHPDGDDTDSDGVPNGCDACNGSDDADDADGDSVPDGCDTCPGFDDMADLDSDGVPDGCDICINGNNSQDADNDGIPNGCDVCPNDPNNSDSDEDGVADCVDGCPDNPDKLAPGLCGCDESDEDSDEDGMPDCNDGCPFNPGLLEPGENGCDDEETSGGVLGSGPDDGDDGDLTVNICGGGSASATSTLMMALAGWHGMRRRRRTLR